MAHGEGDVDIIGVRAIYHGAEFEVPGAAHEVAEYGGQVRLLYSFETGLRPQARGEASTAARSIPEASVPLAARQSVRPNLAHT